MALAEPIGERLEAVALRPRDDVFGQGSLGCPGDEAGDECSRIVLGA